MIHWSLIVALSITSILGDMTVNYDATTADVRNSGAVAAALNETYTGIDDAVVLKEVQILSARAVADASSSANIIIANATGLSLSLICLNQGKFYCQIGETCIPRSWHCDGLNDCLYSEDELGCQSRTSTPPLTTLSTRDICLNQGRFYCQSGGTCISLSFRCDGVNDCLYNEDELGCPSRTSTRAPTTGLPSSCGGTLYGSGYVRSPNYPNNYGNYLRCNWTLIASPYYGNVALYFDAFNTESCCDYVSIYHSNGTLINRYSGSYIPSSLALGSSVIITFTTDSIGVSSGFSIWFTTSAALSTTPSPRDNCDRQGNFYCALSGLCVSMSQRCNGYSYCYYGEDEAGCSTVAPTVTTASTSLCGGTLYGSGYVRSPNYPNNYGNYLRCNWTLIASPYYGNLALYFDAFSTESCCDFLSIYHSNGTLINSYSGSSIPSSLNLGSSVIITFTTDSSAAYSGFSIWFTTSAALSTTPSPRDSCERQGNFYCALSGLCVSMSQRCNGYSYCYYGEDEVGCSTVAPTTTTASPSSCGGTLYGSGYVRSPNYPYNYGNYIRCNWTLIASPYYGNLALSFYAFSTESCCDFVSIYHSNGTLINRYSGSYIPSSLTLGSSAVITFTTDSIGVSSGFSIWFATSVAPSTTPSPRDSCERQGNFYCSLSYLCVSMSQRCNGYSYCYYGEDEAGCSTAAPNTTNTSRPSTSQQPQGSFIAASGFAQAFLQLGKSSASDLPRGSWVVISGYVTVVLLGLPSFVYHN